MNDSGLKISLTHRFAPFEYDPYDEGSKRGKRSEGEIPPPSRVVFENIDIHTEKTLSSSIRYYFPLIC